MPTTSTSEIRLVIPCQPEFIGLARLAAAGIAHRLNLDVEQADDLKLAVTEACGFLLSRGGESAGSTIEVEWSFGDEELSVQVRRAGIAGAANASPPTQGEIRAEIEQNQDNAKSKNPTDAEIGLFLIHALMDVVTEIDDGTGLLMTKAIQRTADE